MKKTTKIALTFSSIVLLSSTATYAASTDFIDHGSYTTDTISGLDWLDVTTSVNQSYNYVNSQFGAGGVYEGWRYATVFEFNTLINHYTDTFIATGTEYIQHQDGKLDGLATIMGATSSTMTVFNGTPRSMPYTYGMLDSSDINYARIAGIRDGLPGISSDSTGVTGGISKGFEASTVGSFLVYDKVSAVPLPSAAFMFAPALLGFLGLRRRKVQA